MSAITTQTLRARTAGPLQFLRKRIGSWGLILALLALPLVRSAVSVLAETPSYAEAGLPEPTVRSAL